MDGPNHHILELREATPDRYVLLLSSHLILVKLEDAFQARHLIRDGGDMHLGS